MFWNQRNRKTENFIKSNQEQAVASWINYLNQVRLDTFWEKLNNQNIKLAAAVETLENTLTHIEKDVIEKNRGGVKGMHGFIAEVSEVGITNARREIVGKSGNCKWVNDNSPVDIVRDGINIQQKFSESKGLFSLNAVRDHLKKYPDYTKNGGKYQIPKDHYDEIKRYLAITKEEADRLPTSTGEFSLKKWTKIQKYFDEGEIRLEDLEPSKVRFDDVQKDQIGTTIRHEEKSLRETDKEIRRGFYEESKPNLKEGAQATLIAAGIEGAATFVIAIRVKIKAGKKIGEFTAEDWREICGKTGGGFAKGCARGVTIYTLTNFTATPAFVASSMATASFAVAEQAHLLKTGKISEEQFLLNSQVICVDTSVSALSSMIGQAVIPVPVLGAVIGNTVGMLMNQIAKEYLSHYEQRIIREYLREINAYEEQLNAQYREIIQKLGKEFSMYMKILDRAFVPDYEEAFTGSIILAEYVGVDPEKILRNKEDGYNYFLR